MEKILEVEVALEEGMLLLKMVILTSKSPMESSIIRMEALEDEEDLLVGVGKETKAEDLVFSLLNVTIATKWVTL